MALASSGLARAEPPAPPLGEGLTAAANELARVAASAEALQAALSPLLRRGGEPADAGQALDDVTQHLHGLCDFITALAASCPPDWRLDVGEAASGLRLHAQRLRLTSNDPSPAAAPLPRAEASGELELW